MLVEAPVTEATVEVFDEDILHRLARRDVIPIDAVPPPAGAASHATSAYCRSTLGKGQSHLNRALFRRHRGKRIADLSLLPVLRALALPVHKPELGCSVLQNYVQRSGEGWLSLYFLILAAHYKQCTSTSVHHSALRAAARERLRGWWLHAAPLLMRVMRRQRRSFS